MTIQKFNYFKRILLLILIFLFTCNHSSAKSEPVVDSALVNKTRQAIKKAAEFIRSIAMKGGYAGIYSKDLEKRWGESERQLVGKDRIWIQPPGTPRVGLTFLYAYSVTKDKYYLEAAIETACALAWGQSVAGGWDYLPSLSHMKLKKDKIKRVNKNNVFDDNTTQEAINFLISLDEIHDESWLTEAVELALKFMQKSQFENGAWPQKYPLRGNKYQDYYTFNDKAMNDCIKVMLKAHQVYKKDAYLECAVKGGEFILISPVSKEQPGWAQQYSQDMKPAKARKFEPASVCSAVTARNIKTLIDFYLYTGDKKFLKPIDPALAWLERSKIGENKWARMYELKSNRPVYGDRDGKVYYKLTDISEERQKGYSWESDYGIPKVIKYYEEVKNKGIEKYLAKRNKKISSEKGRKKAADMESKIRKIISALDKKGAWVGDDKIYIRTFVDNIESLCRYLELSGLSLCK